MEAFKIGEGGAESPDAEEIHSMVGILPGGGVTGTKATYVALVLESFTASALLVIDES